MKVSVIGMGSVGAETVRGLMNMAEITEIVAINRTRAKAEGDVEDLYHTTALSETYGAIPRVGDYPDLVGSDIVVVTAGTNPKAGGTREDVLLANCDIVRDVMVEIGRYSPEAVVLIATNPVDVATQVALSHSGFPKNRVIGTGTLIDTMRLVSLISETVKVDPRSVFGYVLGEHGSTSSIPWSLCKICGMDVETFCRLNCVERFDKELIRKRVLAAGHSIFNKKGYTNYGISAGISRIIRAIAVDENAVLPVGTLLKGEYGIDGVVMSLPCVIGRNGVERIVRCDFSAAEIDKLNQSASRIRELLSLVANRELQAS